MTSVRLRAKSWPSTGAPGVVEVEGREPALLIGPLCAVRPGVSRRRALISG